MPVPPWPPEPSLKGTHIPMHTRAAGRRVPRRPAFAGGFAFTGENVALKLPDGTTVGTIQDGDSQSIELIGPESTAKDLFSRFEIEDPAAGEYTLLVRSFDDAVDEIPFTIE